MMMVGRGDHDRIDVGEGQHLAVRSKFPWRLAVLLLDQLRRMLARDAPGISDRRHNEILRRDMLADPRQMRPGATVAAGKHADRDAVVRPRNPGVAGGGHGQGDGCTGNRGGFNKLASSGLELLSVSSTSPS